jgi:hypothetical protein
MQSPKWGDLRGFARGRPTGSQGLDMTITRRSGLLAAAILLLTAFGESPATAQSTGRKAGHGAVEKATVVLATDLRELTSMRDIAMVGDVFFRRIERSQGRANGDYDLAVSGSASADWKSVFGSADDNRAPHVFTLEPGTYIIEKINIGGGPTTSGPGLDEGSRAPRFGSFTVRPGEVLNLGRLVVHMHWDEGYFYAKVEDDSADAQQALAAANPQAAAKLQTRLLTVAPRFAFQTGGGRL